MDLDGGDSACLAIDGRSFRQFDPAATRGGLAVKVDPITTEVIRNALVALTEEMKLTLVNTAYNPLIYEVKDFSAALTDEAGNLYGQAAGLTVFLACLPATIKNGLIAIGRENLAEGDIILANDPFTTGTHISDTAVYIPIFYASELVAFSINMAHWADVGGMIPGGWTPNSTDVFQEGLRFTHLKLYRGGELNSDLERLIRANVRFPEIVFGDLSAQIAACQTGVRRYQALCKKYGPDTIRAAMRRVFDESEQLTRARVRDIPDGVYWAETFMDHDGVELDKPRKVKVTVTVAGSDMTVDLTGSSETCSGPINLPLIGTRAAVETAFKALTVPLDPTNAGHMRSLQVIAPENTIVNPQFPAPTDSYGYASNTVMDLVIRALAPAIPEKCAAGTYQLFGIYLYRVDPRFGKPFLFIEPTVGGWGGRQRGDGQSLIFYSDGDTPNTPAEVIEARYPILVGRYTYHLDSAGIGQYRGGLGIIRDYNVLTDHVYLHTFNEGTKCPPWGLFGGKAGQPCYTVAWPDTPKELVLRDRQAHVGPLFRGDTVSVRSGGGGGWGDPLQRDPALVARDVKNELLSVEAARQAYAVLLDPATYELDVDGTQRERAALIPTTAPPSSPGRTATDSRLQRDPGPEAV
jgi:N-methylhydantoinase B